MPFSISIFRYMLGARSMEFTLLFDMQLVEYFIPIEIRYLPAFKGI